MPTSYDDRSGGSVWLSPQRTRVLTAVARSVPASSQCVRVGIDGVDGAGKSVFADQLAQVLRADGRPVVRASVDDFHHVRAVRYRRGRDSPLGFWLDSFDYAALRRELLDPLGPGGSGRYRRAVHDVETDAHLDLPFQTATAGTVLVLDGLFLHRDELAGGWDFSVFLDVPFPVSAARMAIRDGSVPDPAHPSLARYVRGQLLYFAECSPWERADVVVDNRDWNEPALVRGAGQV